MKLAAVAALSLLTLAACATQGGGKQVAANDYDKMKSQCDARGGIMKMRTTGPISPYAQLNDYCDMTNAPFPDKPTGH
jgi:hypothetical protein